MNEQLGLFPQLTNEENRQNIDVFDINTNWDDFILDGQNLTSQSNSSSMVILGDSLSVLQHIKTGSIDLIFSDPPYNINKDFGNNKDKWDSVKDYIEWCKKWIDECMRVLKDSGTMYFMTATQHMPYLDVYVSEKYNVLCRIIWSYDSSGVQSKKMFGSLYEPILMINKTNSSKYTFNYKDILVEAKTGAQRKLIDYLQSIFVSIQVY